ncbi:MAG: hypothetical protein DRN91_05755 [Candidatus Alkanophagales archaeon]|nr:MAG: hypothetical protein DRN91_05755 [Candidatus Alkanophagales archaeon]
MIIVLIVWRESGMSSTGPTHKIYAIAWSNNKYTVYMLIRNPKGEVIGRRIIKIDGKFLGSREKILEYIVKELKKRKLRVE